MRIEILPVVTLFLLTNIAVTQQSTVSCNKNPQLRKDESNLMKRIHLFNANFQVYINFIIVYIRCYESAMYVCVVIY